MQHVKGKIDIESSTPFKNHKLQNLKRKTGTWQKKGVVHPRFTLNEGNVSFTENCLVTLETNIDRLFVYDANISYLFINFFDLLQSKYRVNET